MTLGMGRTKHPILYAKAAQQCPYQVRSDLMLRVRGTPVQNTTSKYCICYMCNVLMVSCRWAACPLLPKLFSDDALGHLLRNLNMDVAMNTCP